MDLLPLRPSTFREVRARDLRVGDVVFARGSDAPFEVIGPPKVIQRGFAYLVGQWGFPQARLAFDVRQGDRVGVMKAWDGVLFRRPKRRLLPRL